MKNFKLGLILKTANMRDIQIGITKCIWLFEFFEVPKNTMEIMLGGL